MEKNELKIEKRRELADMLGKTKFLNKSLKVMKVLAKEIEPNTKLLFRSVPVQNWYKKASTVKPGIKEEALQLKELAAGSVGCLRGDPHKLCTSCALNHFSTGYIGFLKLIGTSCKKITIN